MEGDVEDERLNRPPRWAEPFEKDWDKPFEQYWNAPVGKDWEALFQKDWEAPFEQRSHETAERMYPLASPCLPKCKKEVSLTFRFQ